MQTYHRGDIYYADLGDGIGSEQKGYRPIVIIQNNIGNKYSPTVIVASITSKAGIKTKLPTHFYIQEGNGLEKPSIGLLEQLRTIDKKRLGTHIGKLTEAQTISLNHALAISIGLSNQIPNSLVMCLCQTCVKNFRSADAYYLKPVDSNNKEKDICTYCNSRNGYDYEVISKK